MTTTRYFSLARHALVEGLRAISIKPGEAVAMPALICREILASLATVGAKPVFYPVDEWLKPVELPRDKEIRAIIAVNYFGFAQDLMPFIEYCSTTGAVLIEDNAHGFLSSDETGKLLGTRGALGITSIRKTIRIPDGATLSVNEDRFLEHIHVQLPTTSHSIRPDRLRRLSANIQRRFHIPVLRLMRTVSRTFRSLKTGSSLPISSPANETEILKVVGPHKASLRILEQLDSNSEVDRRSRLFVRVHESLAGLSLTPLFSGLPRGTVPYGYPFLSDELTAQDAQRRVANYGVEIIRWPELPDAIVKSAPPHYKNLWLVNFL